MEVLGAMICPSSCGRRQRDHIKFQGPAEVRGGGREGGSSPVPLLSLPPAQKLNSPLASFPRCGRGHITVQPPQLLWVWCVDPPPLLRQPYSGRCKPGTPLTAASTREERRSTCQQVGAPGDSQGLQGPIFLIQMWHAAVADYLAVWLLPLPGGAEGSFVNQTTGSTSRYHDLLVS